MKKTKYLMDKRTKPFDLKFIGLCLIAFLIISTILIGIIVAILSVNNIHIEDMKSTTSLIRITNDNFVDTIIKNSKLKLNKNYYLDEKITLDSDKISKLEDAGELHFYGTLDGRGHEIEVDAIMTTPLFHQIAEGSTVKQLVIKNAEVRNPTAHSLAILTNINNGTIENIKISDAKVDTEGVSVAGCIAAYNFNQIKHCVISVYFGISSAYTNANQPGMAAIWNCALGAVAGINGENGQISGAIVAADFTNDFVVLTRQLYKNTLVGYSLGCWDNEEDISDIHIINPLYEVTAHDVSKLKESNRVKIRTLDELTSDNFISNSWNDNQNGWVFVKGELPSLKIRQVQEV